MDADLDATAQAELVRGGEVSPRELVEAAIDRVEALNGDLNAVIHPLFDKALAEGPAAGPFRGVPMVVKDLVAHTAGDPFHEGIRLLREIGWTEPDDTWLVERFRDAGFVFIGKTNTPELGICPRPSRRPTAHAKPMGQEPVDRRIERRLGRCGGRGDGVDRPRQRRRRLDPHPGLGLRSRRVEALARAGIDGARVR